MRRTANEMMTILEQRVARLEKKANSSRQASFWPFTKKTPTLPITQQIGPLFVSVQAVGNGFSVYVSDAPRKHKFVNSNARSVSLPKEATASDLARSGCLFSTLEEARRVGNIFINKYAAVMNEAVGGF
jgi:hypothetical protein